MAGDAVLVAACCLLAVHFRIVVCLDVKQGPSDSSIVVQEDLVDLQPKRMAGALLPKLHFLSIGHAGATFWSELFGVVGGQPYVFEPYHHLHDELVHGMSSWNLPNEWFWNKNGKSSKEKVTGRLECLYESCKNCKQLVAEPRRLEVDYLCNPPAWAPTASWVVANSIHMNDFSPFLDLPLTSLRGSKFVILFRDPRALGRKDGCVRMFQQAVTARKLARYVGEENVRTLFFEQWSREVPQTLQELASWADNTTVTRAMMKHAMAEQQNDDKRAAWFKAGESNAGDNAWCNEFFDLVGYPSQRVIRKDDHVHYENLRDPVHANLTARQEKAADYFFSSGAGNTPTSNALYYEHPEPYYDFRLPFKAELPNEKKFDPFVDIVTPF